MRTAMRRALVAFDATFPTDLREETPEFQEHTKTALSASRRSKASTSPTCFLGVEPVTDQALDIEPVLSTNKLHDVVPAR